MNYGIVKKTYLRHLQQHEEAACAQGAACELSSPSSWQSAALATLVRLSNPFLNPK